jgi:opacity protein-like surface antigen
MKENKKLYEFFNKPLHSRNGVIEMKNYIYCIIALVCIFSTTFYAQTGVTKVGTTAASFLAIDVGPRANAMGSAFVSVANDVTAMYWNPAGIANLDGFQMMFSNTKWIADVAFNYAGIAMPLGDFGTLGLNATFVTMDQIERTTVESPDGTGEFVNASSYAFGLTYARELTDQFLIGFNAKFAYEKLYNSSATGVALDVGALFDTQISGLKLGMSISNYGTKMQLQGQDFIVQNDPYPNISGNNGSINSTLSADAFDLPLMFRLGISMDVFKELYGSSLIISADALHPSDDVESVNIGGEYVFQNMLSLRIGYKGLFAKDSEQGMNYGGGLRLNVAGNTCLLFDYSYISFGDLNSVHMFSVGFGI